MSARQPRFALGLTAPRATERGAARRPRGVLLLDALSATRTSPKVWMASAALHAVLLLTLLRAERAERVVPPESSRDRPASVQMVYVAPATPKARKAAAHPPSEPPRPLPPPVSVEHPPRPAPAPPPTPVASPASTEESRDGLAAAKMPKVPDHDEPAPMTRMRSNGAPDDADGAPSASPSHAPPPSTAAAPRAADFGSRHVPVASDYAARDAAMVSEARRLFGPHPTGEEGGQGIVGPVAQAGAPVYLPAGGRRCVITNQPVAATDDAPGDGVVEGIVRREGSGVPLPGAFMQIIGTPYVTFSDARGHYRLAFDPHLVDGCRTQVVRVTAKGYRARTLVLAIGRADNTVELPPR